MVAVAVGEEEAGEIADRSGYGCEVVTACPEAFVGGGVAEDLLLVIQLRRKWNGGIERL